MNISHNRLHSAERNHLTQLEQRKTPKPLWNPIGCMTNTRGWCHEKVTLWTSFNGKNHFNHQIMATINLGALKFKRFLRLHIFNEIQLNSNCNSDRCRIARMLSLQKKDKLLPFPQERDHMSLLVI